MKKATMIKIYNEYQRPFKKFRGVVNESNIDEIFSIVKEGYTITQHDELLEVVNATIKDRNLKAVVDTTEMNDGARVHIAATFPNISLDIEDNGIQAQLYCTYDNSYDVTTGLRLNIGARIGKAVLWIDDSRYFHKHTKNISVAEFEKRLDQGVESFQKQIKDHFTKMFKTTISHAAAVDFLEKVGEVKDVTKKYIDSILVQMKKTTIKNKWQLYCLICEVISTESSSIDVRDRQLKLVIGKMHVAFKSNAVKEDTKSDSAGTPSLTNNTKEVSKINGVNITELSVAKDALTAANEGTITLKLTIEKVNRKKFKVMKGDTVIDTFKKLWQARNFVKQTK